MAIAAVNMAWPFNSSKHTLAILQQQAHHGHSIAVSIPWPFCSSKIIMPILQQ